MHKDVAYSVERGRRKTISVTVREGSVVVRAPFGMQDEKIAAFVGAHEGWIRAKLARFAASAEKFADVRAGRAVLFRGRAYPVVFGGAENEEKDGVFYLKRAESVRAYFEKEYFFLLAEKTAVWARAVGRMPEDVSARDFKSRWGCCDARRRIRLHWRLVMLPEDLCDYVIVHELCHLLHLDHSPSFWAEVARVLPDQAARKKRLKEYSFLTLLYRSR